jgi:hypothetical protein
MFANRHGDGYSLVFTGWLIKSIAVHKTGTSARIAVTCKLCFKQSRNPAPAAHFDTRFHGPQNPEISLCAETKGRCQSQATVQHR